MKSEWKKAYRRTIDQREELLPPAWLSYGNGESEIQLPRDASGSSYAVYCSGEDRRMAGRVVELLESAGRMVVMSSFLLADRTIEDAMLVAAKRGARVYVLLASEARLGKEAGEGEFDQRVLKEHREMLKRLAGWVLFRTAEHFHAKFVLIDPYDSPRGLLLTANLTEAALERNEELGVSLTPKEVREAAELARWALWESAQHEMLDPDDRLRAVQPLKTIARPEPGKFIVATTQEAGTLRNGALSIIDNAQRKLVVASFGWESDHPVVERLCKRAGEIDVTILARIRPAAMPALLKLRKAGAVVLGFKWLHAKAIIADDEHALIMSANFEKQGLDQGFELGVSVVPLDPRIDELSHQLAHWIKTASWRLETCPKLGETVGACKLWLNKRLEEKEIKAIIEVPLGEHEAESADKLVVEEPRLPKNGQLPRLAHRLECHWTVKAPELPARAKEIFQGDGEGGSKKEWEQDKKPRLSYDPRVFSVNKKRLIAIESPRQLDKARALGKRLSIDRIVVDHKKDR